MKSVGGALIFFLSSCVYGSSTTYSAKNLHLTFITHNGHEYTRRCLYNFGNVCVAWSMYSNTKKVLWRRKMCFCKLQFMFRFLYRVLTTKEKLKAMAVWVSNRLTTERSALLSKILVIVCWRAWNVRNKCQSLVQVLHVHQRTTDSNFV